MLVWRGLSVLNTLKLLSKNTTLCKSNVRNSHIWSYRRSGPPPNKRVLLAAELIQGLTWWWVLWHLCTEYEHITGEFSYPEPSLWTDEELGIPSEES